jgi:hypothetical protein
MYSLEQWELVTRIERGMLLERADRIARRGGIPAPRLGLVSLAARLWLRLTRPQRLLPAVERTVTSAPSAPRAPALGAVCPHLRATRSTGAPGPAGRRARASTH